MNNKERYLKFIKDFNWIGVSNICEELKKDKSSFYTCRLSLENMQLITSKIREHIKRIYPLVKDDEFVLKSKEDNIKFAKDIKNIISQNILYNFKIDIGSLYTYKLSESKYELVVNEIKSQLDEVYKKYSK